MPPSTQIWPVIALTLLFTLGVGATLPVLPYAVREVGGNGTALGIVLGVFPLAALLGRLVGGRSTDRIGRVLTLRTGLATSVLAGVLLVLPLPLWGLVVARTVHGLADALVYTAASAWVLDRTPESRRPQAISLLGAGLWGGYALGPLLGAVLDLPGVGLVIMGSSAVAMLLTVRLPDGFEVVAAHVSGLRALLPRGVAVPGTVLGLGNLAYAAVVGFIVLHLDDRGGHGAAGLVAFSFAVLVGRLLVVPLAVRWGIMRSLPLAFIVMVAGLLVIASTGDTVAAASAAAVVGLASCLPFPALASLVAARVPAAQRGAALAALTGFYDVFVGVGSLAGGLLVERWGTPAVFVAAAGGVLVAPVVLLLVTRHGGGVEEVPTTGSAPNI